MTTAITGTSKIIIITEADHLRVIIETTTTTSIGTTQDTRKTATRTTMKPIMLRIKAEKTVIAHHS